MGKYHTTHAKNQIFTIEWYQLNRKWSTGIQRTVQITQIIIYNTYEKVDMDKGDYIDKGTHLITEYHSCSKS